MMRTIVSAFVLIAALFAIERTCVRPYVCNVTRKSVMTSTLRAYDRRATAEGRALAARNLTRLRDRDRHCAGNVQSLMLQAGNHRILGQHDRAAAKYEAALAIEKRPEIFMNLAQTQSEMLDFDRAVANYVQAARFDPFYLARIPDGPVRNEVVRQALVHR
jgi:tetratricopeptide (TPR) repeat protein